MHLHPPRATTQLDGSMQLNIALSYNNAVGVWLIIAHVFSLYSVLRSAHVTVGTHMHLSGN